jgi:D-Tyr-tRNAtyr deacylase
VEEEEEEEDDDEEEEEEDADDEEEEANLLSFFSIFAETMRGISPSFLNSKCCNTREPIYKRKEKRDKGQRRRKYRGKCKRRKERREIPRQHRNRVFLVRF